MTTVSEHSHNNEGGGFISMTLALSLSYLYFVYFLSLLHKLFLVLLVLRALRVLLVPLVLLVLIALSPSLSYLSCSSSLSFVSFVSFLSLWPYYRSPRRFTIPHLHSTSTPNDLFIYQISCDTDQFD